MMHLRCVERDPPGYVGQRLGLWSQAVSAVPDATYPMSI